MNKSANLIMALGLCVFCARSAPAQLLYDANQPQVAGVQMTLTHLSVNEQTLDLSWKIKNNTDHEVWICDSLDSRSPSVFEWFLDEDARTLVIRRRFGLPVRITSRERYNPAGQYVRLGAGQEKAESISIALPVEPRRMFSGESGNAEYAERLALEIGFYDESLPALILEIVELAEHFKIDLGVGSYPFSEELSDRFFGGRRIAALFTSDLGFGPNVRSADASGEMWMFHMGEIDMGEKVLRIEVDGLSIPYKSNYPPLVEEETPSDVTTVLTKLDVNDTNLTLAWKIINNTNHDVWVCNGYNRGESIYYFERYIDKDNKTLVLRRRYNLSSEGIIVERYPSPFRYLRLRPGQEKVESHSFTLPVTSITLFHAPGEGRLNVESAQRLAIEIGFYDEDLRALILGVVEIAERLGCDDSAIRNVESSDASTMRLYYRFFGGFTIAKLFTTKNISFFRNSVTSDGDEILMPHMFQSLNGEQVLRIEVENLSIPFSIH